MTKPRWQWRGNVIVRSVELGALPISPVTRSPLVIVPWLVPLFPPTKSAICGDDHSGLLAWCESCTGDPVGSDGV